MTVAIDKQRYARGDRVVSTASWHGQQAGTISRAGRGVSVMLRWDGANKDERVHLDAIRQETAEDVTKRAHAERMRAWEDAKPAHDIVTLERDRSWYSTHRVTGFSVRASTPDQMRTAARELEALADWFARRPESP